QLLQHLGGRLAQPALDLAQVGVGHPRLLSELAQGELRALTLLAQVVAQGPDGLVDRPGDLGRLRAHLRLRHSSMVLTIASTCKRCGRDGGYPQLLTASLDFRTGCTPGVTRTCASAVCPGPVVIDQVTSTSCCGSRWTVSTWAGRPCSVAAAIVSPATPSTCTAAIAPSTGPCSRTSRSWDPGSVP